ncbi:MAG: hypothetical protein ACPHGV_03740 [Synechococcus sp.]
MPLNLLSRAMQLMHNRGLAIVSVNPSGTPATAPAATPLSQPSEAGQVRRSGKRRRRGKH